MATITLNIDVDNNQFEEMCVNNINDISKEKIEEILLKAVETALLNDTKKNYNDGSNILVTKVTDGYSSRYEATPLLKSVIKKIDTEKYIDPIAEMVGNYIKQNYKDLITKYIIEEIGNLLFSPEKEYSLKRDMYDFVQSAINRYYH